MRNSKDDRIEDGRGLSEQRRQDSDQWCDGGLISESSLQHNAGVGSPHTDPQRNVHQCDPCDTEFGTLRVDVRVASQ